MSNPVTLHIDSSAGRQTLTLPHPGQQALTQILRRIGLPLNTRCGERGLCEGCTVELTRGSVIAATTGQIIHSDGLPITIRGCEHRVADDVAEVSIFIPPRSLLVHQPQVVSEYRINVPWSHDPLITASQPGARGTRGTRGRWGAAIDVGTTTVAVLLVDLTNGNVVGKAAGFNRQMHLGDDVITRISLCASSPAMISQLQDAIVVQTIGPLLRKALAEAMASELEDDGHWGMLGGMTIAGNTTMLHLLAGVDPTPLGTVPFTPAFLEHRVLSAAAIGLPLPTRPNGSGLAAAGTVGTTDEVDPVIHLLPGASAYVGADLVAGSVASGLAYDERPSLLVDAGTNGEIIFKHGDVLLGCATAAGPAFEGSRLTSGVRATRGAIDEIRMDRSPFALHSHAIGGHRPIGLCGSAYIDFLGQGRATGLLNAMGRFDEAFIARADVSPHIVRPADGPLAFKVADGPGEQPLLISESDVASLLQAKAAIAAGILTLLEHAGVTPRQVKTLYLAGGFGTHMNRANAIACGLLPGFTVEQVQVVGNSALAGAYLALVDSSVLPELGRLAAKMKVLELNQAPGFEDRYIEQLGMA